MQIDHVILKMISIIIFIMNSVVPSPILMLNLTHNDTHVIATWSEPQFPNGNISYLINLTCTNLLVLDITVIAYEEVLTTKFVLFFTVRHYTKYTVSVTPLTGAGAGKSSMYSLITDQGGIVILF